MAGSRVLSANAAVHLAGKAISVYYAMKVEWGGEVGDKWYDDAGRTIDGITFEKRVSMWNAPIETSGQMGQWDVSLKDEDSAIRDIISSASIGGKVVSLYLVWPDSAEEDWVLLWKGITEEKAEWSEDSKAQLTMTVLDFGNKIKDNVSSEVDDDDLPYASPGAFGKSLPVVYGKKRGVAGVCVKGGGPITELTKGFSVDDMEFYVHDASEFPASSVESPIDVWIGREKVRGYFTDNKFTITDRNLLMHSGQLTFAANDYHILNLDTDQTPGYWIGFAIRFKIYNFTTEEYVGPYQYRTIVSHVNPELGTEQAAINSPFGDGQTNGIWPVTEYDMHSGYTCWKPTGHEEVALDYDITTARESHGEGESVLYAPSGGVVYVLSSRPASAVNRVFVLAQSDNKRRYVPPGMYEVDLNDSQFAGIFGHNCTTITFQIPPAVLTWSLIDYKNLDMIQVSTIRARRADNSILADVDGPVDDEDAVIENPAEIISHIAQEMGLLPAEIDAATVALAAAARSDWRMAFAFSDAAVSGRDFIEALARQAFLEVSWSQGKLKLLIPDNGIDVLPAVTALADTNVEVSSYRITKTGVSAAITRIETTFVDHDGMEQRVVKQTDSTMKARYGIKSRGVEGWAYQHRNPLKAMLSRWLYRERYSPSVEIVNVFLDNLSLMVGDIVTVHGNKGWVSGIRVILGQKGVMDKVEVSVRVPPTVWYDETWVYPSPVYTDPALPEEEELEPFLPSHFPSQDPAGEEIQLATKDEIPDVEPEEAVNEEEEAAPEGAAVEVNEYNEEAGAPSVTMPSGDPSARLAVAVEDIEPGDPGEISESGVPTLVEDIDNAETGDIVGPVEGSWVRRKAADGDRVVLRVLPPEQQPLDPPVVGAGLAWTAKAALLPGGGIYVRNIGSTTCPKGGILWTPQFSPDGTNAYGLEADLPGLSNLCIAATDIGANETKLAYPPSGIPRKVLCYNWMDLKVGDRVAAYCQTFIGKKCNLGPITVNGQVAEDEQLEGASDPPYVGYVRATLHGRRGEHCIVIDREGEIWVAQTMVFFPPYKIDAATVPGAAFLCHGDEAFGKPQFAVGIPPVLVAAEGDREGYPCIQLVGDKTLSFVEAYREWNVWGPNVWLMPNLHGRLDIPAEQIETAPPSVPISVKAIQLGDNIITEWLGDGMIIFVSSEEAIEELLTTSLANFVSGAPSYE